jgi:hypothetical protein
VACYNKSSSLLFAQGYPQWYENVGFVHSGTLFFETAPGNLAAFACAKPSTGLLYAANNAQSLDYMAWLFASEKQTLAAFP